MVESRFEVTPNLAFKEVRAKRREFTTVEHLLLALLDNEAAATVLRACGANLRKLRRDLQEFIDSTTPLDPAARRRARNPADAGASSASRSAVYHVQSSGKREVIGATSWWRSPVNRKARRCSCSSQQSIARIDVVNSSPPWYLQGTRHAEHPQDGGAGYGAG